MSRFNPNIYEQQIIAKGRDLPAATITERKVPDSMKDRYPTWEAYQDAMADFLNGN